MKFNVGVIIVSDRAASGERTDRSLPIFKTALTTGPYDLVKNVIVPDEPDQIMTALKKMIAEGCHLVFTSGGTGCSPRDNTPDVTGKIITKPTPGLDEAIREFSRKKSPHAVFSRAVSGLAGKSYVVNLPGSPGAVKEILDFVLPLIVHPLKLMTSQITDCSEDPAINDKL